MQGSSSVRKSGLLFLMEESVFAWKYFWILPKITAKMSSLASMTFTAELDSAYWFLIVFSIPFLACSISNVIWVSWSSERSLSCERTDLFYDLFFFDSPGSMSSRPASVKKFSLSVEQVAPYTSISTKKFLTSSTLIVRFNLMISCMVRVPAPNMSIKLRRPDRYIYMSM